MVEARLLGMPSTYELVELLGEGGMCRVFAARNIQLGGLVAIKALRGRVFDGETTERFLREARLLARLRSQHVARVFDAGVADDGELAGTPYIVMEHLEGLDLERMTRGRCLSMAEVVELAFQACEGLAEAHALGIVHRDIKPSNIFVTEDVDGTPLVKLLDFGVSFAEGPGQRLTDQSRVLGTPTFMPLEVMASARNADSRSDIWSLGATLYRLFAGRGPFDGATNVFAAIDRGPPPLDEVAPWVDAELAAVVMRCLERLPKNRFDSVVELADQLADASAQYVDAAARAARIRNIARVAAARAAPRKAPLQSGIVLLGEVACEDIETLSA
jgi:serine/threonine-protein kinase